MKKEIRKFFRFFKIALPITFMPFAMSLYMHGEVLAATVIGFPCCLLLESFIKDLVFVDDILEEDDDKDASNSNNENS